MMSALAKKEVTSVLTKAELTRQLLALVLTAVLVWHTVLIPPSAYAPAKRPRRRSRGDEERGTHPRRGALNARIQSAEAGSSEEAAVEPVDDLDWPEFIGLN